MLDIERETEKFLRKIRREKIQQPGPDQYVERCHYSKTGWGIHNTAGDCTCKPAKAPTEKAKPKMTKPTPKPSQGERGR